MKIVQCCVAAVAWVTAMSLVPGAVVCADEALAVSAEAASTSPDVNIYNNTDYPRKDVRVSIRSDNHCGSILGEGSLAYHESIGGMTLSGVSGSQTIFVEVHITDQGRPYAHGSFTTTVPSPVPERWSIMVFDELIDLSFDGAVAGHAAYDESQPTGGVGCNGGVSLPCLCGGLSGIACTALGFSWLTRDRRRQ